MADAVRDAELDPAQQRLFDELDMTVDAAADGLALMHVAQNIVNLLLKRSEDRRLRDDMLAEVSRFCLGILQAPELSEHYRVAKIRMFAKAIVRIIIAKRPEVTSAEMAGVSPPAGGRRAMDAGTVA